MIEPIVQIKDVDRRFYERSLRDFLPPRIIDIHTHVWRASDYPPPKTQPPTGELRFVTWPARVARENPIEDHLRTYRLMLPQQQVTPLIFASLPEEGNTDRVNAYVAQCARERNLPALIFSDPAWSASELEEKVLAGGFIGIKSYLTMAPAYLPAKEIRIFDYFPPHQFELIGRRGWIVILHIPRDGRLADPVNLAQMLQIERRWPNVRLIVAHVGRAYCNHDVGDAFTVLAESKRMLFDFSANTNDAVFEQLIRAVGPKRILFGSDMPVTRMRMRRITQGDHYVNLVPQGLYGDVSGDKNMGELEGEEAEKLTFFLYEELDAFRRAAQRAGLKSADLEDVFYNNAKGIIDGARQGSK